MSADKHDDGQRPGFKVSDRRSFVDAPPAPAPPQVAPEVPAGDAGPVSSASSASKTDQAPGSADDLDALPPVDFHTFILSLGSSALLHLGELDHPDGREAQPDLRLAKHTIDIIGMLQEKTRGNLSPPEERLIESLLYDLRLRYVERGKDQTK